jgi:hypothetical protein
MAPIASAVHILLPVFVAVMKAEKQLRDFDYLNQNASVMLEQILPTCASDQLFPMAAAKRSPL